jgi:hypothetical protein
VAVGAAFVTGAEACDSVAPGQAAFDDPADLAQPGAMRYAAAGEAWGEAAFAEQAAVFVEVVAAVGEQLARLVPGSAAPAADRWDRVE